MRSTPLCLLLGAALALCSCGSDEDSKDSSADTSETDTSQSDTGDTDTGDTENTGDGYTVTMETTHGTMVIVLDPINAPITVGNFLQYVDEGFYDGGDGLGATTFHRVVEDFVIQGGGYTADGTLKDTHDPIVLEADNGLSNLRGTVAMARTGVPDSATTQFFVNQVDNTFLDSTGNNDGYAVFGELSAGLDVVDLIAGLAPFGSETPSEDVIITAMSRE